MHRSPAPRHAPSRKHASRRSFLPAAVALGAVVGAVLLAVTVVNGPGPGGDAGAQAGLPNPMGGPALPAPGSASGMATVNDLVVEDTTVAMGDVGLGVTYVPAWEVTNPTDQDVEVVIGQPRVIEGCCPGPVYADGHLTQPGQLLQVPAGRSVRLQFPLQMHPGMDGYHHLAIPIASQGEDVALQVTGNFTADAER